MKKQDTVKLIVNGAVIAAIYAMLTIFLAPMSFGLIQVRVSEMLCVLSYFTPAAVGGLTVGCFIANILGANGIIDAVLGSLATLIGCFGMYKLRKKPYVAPLINIASNGIIIGLMLYYIYGLKLSFGPKGESIAPVLCILTVAAEEAIPMYVLGLPLANIIKKRGLEL